MTHSLSVKGPADLMSSRENWVSRDTNQHSIDKRKEMLYMHKKRMDMILGLTRFSTMYSAIVILHYDLLRQMVLFKKENRKKQK